MLGLLNAQHQSFPQSRNSFKVGMKLEGLDPCHPSLFCVLTVAEVCVQVAAFYLALHIMSPSPNPWCLPVTLLPLRSKATEWGFTLTVTQNATTSGPTPTHGIWNQLAGARRMDTNYCCLKVGLNSCAQMWPVYSGKPLSWLSVCVLKAARTETLIGACM